MGLHEARVHIILRIWIERERKNHTWKNIKSWSSINETPNENMREKVSENIVSQDTFAVTLVSDFTANTFSRSPARLCFHISHMSCRWSQDYGLVFIHYTFLPSMYASFLPSNSSRTAGTWKTWQGVNIQNPLFL